MAHKRAEVDHSARVNYYGALIPQDTTLIINGVVFVPATDLRLGRAHCLESDDLAVQLDVMASTPIGNQLGMFVHLTPNAARAIAAGLMRQADQVDAHVAQQAAAAIEKARKL